MGIDFKKALLATEIREVVVDDLSDRKGFDFDDIDDDVKEEMFRTLDAKIYRVLREEERKK